jgi:hypothetical protein
VAQDREFTDALARLLFEIDTGRLSTAAVTAAITRTIVRWAREQGWFTHTEARVEVPARAVEPQLGFVDVLVMRGAAHPDVAIEIDSTDKPWSVVKLQHAAAAGMHAIWVRWGDDAWAGVYDDVDVIQLRVGRHTRPANRSTDQPTIWNLAEMVRRTVQWVDTLGRLRRPRVVNAYPERVGDRWHLCSAARR